LLHLQHDGCCFGLDRVAGSARHHRTHTDDLEVMSFDSFQGRQFLGVPARVRRAVQDGREIAEEASEAVNPCMPIGGRFGSLLRLAKCWVAWILSSPHAAKRSDTKSLWRGLVFWIVLSRRSQR
jgi:hypothetical protein